MESLLRVKSKMHLMGIALLEVEELEPCPIRKTSACFYPTQRYRTVHTGLSGIHGGQNLACWLTIHNVNVKRNKNYFELDCDAISQV